MTDFILMVACGSMLGYMIGSFRANMLKLRANKLINRADVVLTSEDLNVAEINSVIRDTVTFMINIQRIAVSATKGG